MSGFYFGPPSSSGTEPNRNSGPPKPGSTHLITLKKTNPSVEDNEALQYIERAMAGKSYMIRSQSTFFYMYENEANRIKIPGMVGRSYAVDYLAIGGKTIRDTFMIRFLPSPLYEIEMQREYDMREVEEARRMKVKSLDAKKDVIAEEEGSRKVAKELSDDEALRSFQKAKMIAEQNATVPPTTDAFEMSPMVIPLSEDDKISESRDKKDAKDAKNKEREMKMLNSFLRNKERIKGLGKK